MISLPLLTTAIYLFIDFYNNRLDPIWTLQTGSLFILTTQTKELFAGDGLCCFVRDYDVLSNDEMGHFIVPPSLLYQANGEREVFKLQPPLGKTKEVPGYVAIRCRRATDYDKKFMKEYALAEKDKPEDATSIAQSSQGGKSTIQSIISRNSKVDKIGQKKVRLCLVIEWYQFIYQSIICLYTF